MRDISHSAVERNIGPDATIALDFALTRLSYVVKNLTFTPKMIENLSMTKGIFFTKGFIRIKFQVTLENSYKIVQSNAMKAWKQNSSFLII